MADQKVKKTRRRKERKKQGEGMQTTRLQGE